MSHYTSFTVAVYKPLYTDGFNFNMRAWMTRLLIAEDNLETVYIFQQVTTFHNLKPQVGRAVPCVCMVHVP